LLCTNHVCTKMGFSLHFHSKLKQNLVKCKHICFHFYCTLVFKNFLELKHYLKI
jgi:hypothetical protein